MRKLYRYISYKHNKQGIWECFKNIIEREYQDRESEQLTGFRVEIKNRLYIYTKANN